MKHLFIASMFLSCQAVAADFGTRVAEAKAAAASPEGAKYEQSLGPHIGAAIRACIPPGSTSAANLGTFEVVGSVSPDGKLMNVEVEPKNSVSRCFADRLQTAQLPLPPRSSVSTGGYPVEIEMRITP